jgi:hypothetical protein
MKSGFWIGLRVFFVLAVFAVAVCLAYQFYLNASQSKILKQMISRLEADSRVAEVLVTDVQYNPLIQKHLTTIKFLEYDSLGRPLAPRHFTFSGNIIQFQSLVVRFDDNFIKKADALRGKSAYLFWKVFMLDGANTQEFEITRFHEIPKGYKIDGLQDSFEEGLWREFWDYALHSDRALKKGIKNAQVEAPGMKFVPGILYTLKIEHDGGIRIDTKEIPEILKGERVLK